MKDHVLELVDGKSGYNEKLNTLREYLQAFILKLLHQNKFFRSAAFVGGTALRFLHDLPRFSEDLDFSLERSAPWDFEGVMQTIRSELQLAQYEIVVKVSEKQNVKQAMIKFSGLLHEARLSHRREHNFSVRIDLDTRPPHGAQTETKLVHKFFPLSFFTYELSSLFAGKLHALLSRKYTKGRDFFDLGWYLSRWKWLEPNFVLLKNALLQTRWQGETPDRRNWKELLGRVVQQADWQNVRKDVEVFLERPADMDLFSKENILSLLQKPK